jgi:hypothetical protein
LITAFPPFIYLVVGELKKLKKKEKRGNKGEERGYLVSILTGDFLMIIVKRGNHETYDFKGLDYAEKII